jgi:hypothetical protein
MDHGDAVELAREPFGDQPRPIRRPVVDDRDPRGKREVPSEVVVQPAYTTRERVHLVEHRNHDVDRRGGGNLVDHLGYWGFARTLPARRQHRDRA